MKTLLSALFLAVLLGSWAPFNANSWSLDIGKKTLLSSQKNQLGELAFLDKKKLNNRDTLQVSRYLCGASGTASRTTLFIRNEKNELIKMYEYRNSGLVFSAKAPVSDLLASADFKNGKAVSLYFGIDSKEDAYNDTVLIARLQLK
ncbi:MAG: hypothetical protein FD123_3322 [Bacteroidetes bacterium]|nr:MAG: hypothetical protein FD123_3322 [Bacteroidota bacterium]